MPDEYVCPPPPCFSYPPQRERYKYYDPNIHNENTFCQTSSIKDEIKVKDAIIKLKEEENRIKYEEIKKKDEEIKTKNEEIRVKNEEIRVKTAEILAKNAVIKEKEEEIDCKNNKIIELLEKRDCYGDDLTVCSDNDHGSVCTEISKPKDVFIIRVPRTRK